MRAATNHPGALRFHAICGYRMARPPSTSVDERKRAYSPNPENDRARPVGLGERADDLRHAVVRRGDRRVGILQRLERLHAPEQAPRPVDVGDARLARQRRLRRDRDPVREVGEVGVVGHLVQVEVRAEPRDTQLLQVPPDERVARRVRLPVVGQHLRVGLAAVLPAGAAEQVAELSAELQAALAHDARRDRRVVVGREVEVVRQREFDAARARRSRGRHQEAALALVRQRELEPRRVEDRRAEEAHRRVAGGADHALRVEVELRRLQVPVLARRDAGRVAPVRRPRSGPARRT